MNTKCRYENQSLIRLNKHGARGAVALLLLLPVAGWAGGVVTSCTEADLRAAMAGGGAVNFACDGTITLASTITNVSDTRLDGSGRQVTISGNSAVRAFYVNTNVSFTVLNLTIADAWSQGGSAILNLGGTVNLTGVTFRSNTAVIFNVPNDGLITQASGGAIFNRGGTVAASNCSFVGNAAQTLVPRDIMPAEAWGGAIRNEAGQVDLRSCTFVSNRASGAAGSLGMWLSLSSPGFGGAIHNSGTMTLDLCTFVGNSASGGSGLGGGEFSYHPAGYPGSEGSGGAIFNQGTLAADRTTLSGNTATGGGGGSGRPGSYTALDGYPGAPGGGANGAAICNSGSLWVTRSTFANNVVTGGAGGYGGGGMAVADTGGNGASGGTGGSGLGGALLNSGVASLVNCTIGFNAGSGGAGGAGGGGAGSRYGGSGGAGGNGGSGFGGVDGTCNLINCTLAWNRGQAGPGGAGGLGTGVVQHGADGSPGTSGTAWGGTACGPLVNTLIASNTPPDGDSLTDPKLGPLANNGGPTLTMALLPGSPAIDAGNTSLAPATDQRGFPRPAGLAADIGAFEYGSVGQPPFSYTTNNGTITITGYWGLDGAATIPGTINGLPVSSIGTNAFLYSSLTSVMIPNSVASVGDGAFYHCTSLTNITIPNSVTSVGSYAFCYCTRLTNVTVGNSVTNIGSYAFWGCTSLIAIAVDPQNTNYSSVDGVLFNQSQTTLIQCPGGKAGSYSIPNGVTSIESYAFWGCTSLIAITVDPQNTNYSSVDGVLFNQSQTMLVTCPEGKAGAYTMPNSVTTIGANAFHDCTRLTSITIGNSVTNIGSQAFYYCTSLGGVYFQGNAPSLGDSHVFDGDNNATVYYLPGTTGWGPTFGGLATVQQCDYTYTVSNSTITITRYIGSGGAVTIPSTIGGLPVTSIGGQAFFSCTNLTSLTVADSVTNIGSQAFAYCSSLTALTVDASNAVYSSVDGVLFNKTQTTLIQCPAGKAGSYSIPNGVTSIRPDAFGSCTSLSSLTIPDSLTSIGDRAFSFCSSLTSVTIGNSVTSIPDEAFCYCFSLASVTIPNSVTSIGASAFADCTSLTSVTIGNSATSIGYRAFFYCTSLTSVTIPNSVTSLAGQAFYGCSGLTGVTIPSSVTNIGSQAFSYCTSLGGVYFQGNAPSLGDSHVFDGDNNATVYYLPGTTGWGPTFGGLSTALWCDYTYTTSNNTITLTRYIGSGGAVTIPSTIGGLPVTNIGASAFNNCTSLTSVTIPSSVTSIGEGAFAACTSLTAITVDTNNPAYSSVDGVLFNQSQTTLVEYPGGITGSYTVPNSVTNIAGRAFYRCTSLTSVAIPNGVTSIGPDAFGSCTSLSSLAIPDGVTSIGDRAFDFCTSLTSVTIPSSVTSIGYLAFSGCWRLTSVTISNGVTGIGGSAFGNCYSLTNVTIPDSVTYIDAWTFSGCGLTSVTIGNGVNNIQEDAFGACYSLTGVYFKGNAPSLSDSSVFSGDNNATVYYLPGTTGWGTTFGGRPTALWPLPTIQTSPRTQTAEAGSTVDLRVKASSSSPLFCLWYLNSTNLISWGASSELELTTVQFSQSGAYTVVVTNGAGAVTSAPAMLNVIAAVERRPAEGIQVMGEAGSLLNVDYANSLSATPNWLPLDTISLVSTSQYCFDVSEPLPPQRFYRAWQTGTPGILPSLSLLGIAPAITLTGTIGHSVRLDYINQYGPTDAWVTLATVTLTNTSQLYFDTSARGQPDRLYRVVPLP